MRVKKSAAKRKRPVATDLHFLSIKIASAALEDIDAYAERKTRELGMDVNRTDAVRMLIAKGLKE